MCRRRCVGRGGLVDRMLWPLCAGKIKEVTPREEAAFLLSFVRCHYVLFPLYNHWAPKMLGSPSETDTKPPTVTRSQLSPRQNTMDGDRGTILPLSSTNHTLWDEAAAILSGLIGGGRYGLKIRVPHALGTS